MIKSKKSQVLVYGLIFGFFLGVALYYTSSFIKETPNSYLGESSLNLLKAFSESEKALFYLDLSANYNGRNSILLLSKKGGHSSDSDCGNYLDYNLWNNESNACYPEDIINNFKSIFNKELISYLIQNPAYTRYPISYTLSVTQNNKLNILGTANHYLEFGLSEESPTKEKEDEAYIIRIGSIASEDKFAEAKSNIESGKFEQYIQKYADKYGVDKNLIKAVITQESGGNPISESSSGALGLMQVYSWEYCKSDFNLDETNWRDVLKDPEKNIACGTKILKIKYNEFRKGAVISQTYKENNDFRKIVDNCIKNYPKYNSYIGWESALRAYNGWGCEPPGADTDYVEKIIEYYEAWSGKYFFFFVGEKYASLKKSNGKYLVKPSFKTELNFTLDIFEEIKERASGLIKECSVPEESEKCVKKKIVEYNRDESKKENHVYWALNCDNKKSADENKYIFCVDTNKKINNENVIIKFALYIP